MINYARLWAYDDSGKRLPYRPRNTYYFNLSPRFGRLTLSLKGLYVDPRFTNAENTRFVDYVLLFNPGVSYDLGRFVLSVSAYNLLDGKYRFVEGYTLPGRTYSLKVLLRP